MFGSGTQEHVFGEICPDGSFSWGLCCMQASGHMLSVISEDLIAGALGEESLTD